MKETNGLKRRFFLKQSAFGMAAVPLLAMGKPRPDRSPPGQEIGKVKSYRTLGRTGFRVSDVGSGGPRDEGVLKALLDAGVNYIDTAENYSNGQSERATGKVLKKYDRKKIFVSTKMGISRDRSKESILKRARKSLERLDMDYVDCFMIHSPGTVETLKTEGFHQAMAQLKREGKVRFVGVSNHGSQWNDRGEPMDKVLLAAVADGRFDVFLMVYNYIQREMSERVLNACREKNIGITLMKTNPVGGYHSMKAQLEESAAKGRPISESYQRILERMKAKADKTQKWVEENNLQNPEEIRAAALRFVWSNPAVHTVCCSCDNFTDVEKFVALSGSDLSTADQKMLASFKEGVGQLYCRHACGICESSCRHGVPVNTVMRYNHYFEAQGREKYAMEKYQTLPGVKAAGCSECAGHCEAHCPYSVPIQPLLALAHERLTIG